MVVTQANSAPSSREYFPTVQKIKYEGPNSKNLLAYRYYDAERVVLGKKMKDWLRFSVCFWHTWRGDGSDPFGEGTISRDFENEKASEMEQAKARVRAHFEFCQKLGVEYYAFHDRDVAPCGKNLKETNKNLDEITDLMLELQKQTGIKLLWGTANLFSHKRYMSGASTNPDAHVFAYAAAQVKKAIEVTKKLGGENYVFWGGREGYQTLLNTNMKKELDHMAAFMRMAVEYKNKIGFNGQLLIEPKPREPTSFQYDFDSATVGNFLRTYKLENDFKVNIEANHATLAGKSFEHELQYASSFGFLGSVDANTGDQLLGWDTDQFNTDHKQLARVMKIVVENNGGKGLAPGGLNFDAKVRRESTDIEDLFIAHVSSMDAFARGLLIAAKIKEEGIMEEMLHSRYKSYETKIGKKIETGSASFEDLEEYILGLNDECQEPKQISGQQEKFELVFNRYL